ncbi:DNA helicase-2 / ATP-dependent DNA helicase PcrA [Neorhodopirellula lusitana]|uniref:DNA 3'-5' helicase n=1 Tax=Neorhodopirellula lusitana TaxID=445327 RepID=A0ABY1PQ41_9BACT|nr:UvrD-helicase domain-containing protein [Neorhodopirellula lusitana]SMP42092.1 DNA helicase-2 / ATP-dependent DNA helicase PcrA [Neorhodopirellula lusitana]
MNGFSVEGLNPPQAEAVKTLSGPLLVLAGAGTGKTRVVTFRIANLIKHGVEPQRILAVTFTNKAAGEMQDRVGELLGHKDQPRRKRGAPKVPKPVVSTFHSQCVRMLRDHAPVLGFPKKFSIYDRSDQESIARGILRELRLPTVALKPSDMLNIISGWKSASVRPDEAGMIAATDKEHFAASGYRRYQNALRARGAMDFDDLLLHTEALLTEHEDVRKAEAAKYDHVLVDEYQDTNGSQYRITKALVQEHRNLCVVGDDDQSIYAWRGADVSHILSFSNDWPDAKVVWLEDNYRSTGAILEMANTLIAFNTERHDKVLKPDLPMGRRPRIVQHKDEATEAETVVREIRHLIDNEHIEPKRIAILFRTNEQPRLFETELRKADVPYVMLGSQSFFDRREVRDIVAYLKWINQPDDEVALLRIINTPARGLSNKATRTLIERAVQRGVPVWQVMQDPSAIEDLSPAAQRGIASLKQLCSDVQQRAESDSLSEAMKTLLERTAYGDEIARLYDQPDEREARMASLGEVANAIGAYEDKNEEPDLAGFLSDIALSGREMGSEKDKLAMKNAVWLLTMHAAKGLEFPVVYLVGMEDGILPHSRSVNSGNEDDIAEERRLCYVGITRAQDTLTMSLALTRRKWGKPRPTNPSRFLYEITGKADNPNKYRKKTGRPGTPR